MKKICTVLAKVLIWVLFFWNTGTIQYFNSLPPDPHAARVAKMDSVEGRNIRDGKLNSFYLKRVAIAEKKIQDGKIYSPYDYFTDFRDVEDSAFALGAAIKPMYFELQSCMQKNLSQFSEGEMNQARLIASKYDPRSSNASSPILSSIQIWMIDQYIKDFILAFALFCIWMYQRKETQQLPFRNPLSFIICLILYPVIIGYSVIRWWRNTSREVSASVEILRTREKMFSLFSKDEIASVKKFTNSTMSLKEFRGVLRFQGLTIRHAFIPALIALLIMQLIPVTSIGGIVAVGYDTRAEIQQVTRPKEFVTQHQMRTVDIKQCTQNFWWKFDTDEGNLEPVIKIVKKVVSPLYVYKVCRGHLNGVDHIPLNDCLSS